MPNTQELRQLTRWCAARHLHWQPSRTEEGQPAILLRPDIGRAAWHDMLLVEGDEGIALIDEVGDILARASEIPALLDALDSGLITKPQPRPPSPSEWPALAYAGVASDTSWNRLGVAMT